MWSDRHLLYGSMCSVRHVLCTRTVLCAEVVVMPLWVADVPVVAVGRWGEQGSYCK